MQNDKKGKGLFIAQGKNIIYFDETWINVGHTILQERKDKFIITPKDPVMCRLTTGLWAPTAEVQGLSYWMWVVQSKWFVENGQLFLAKKISGLPLRDGQ